MLRTIPIEEAANVAVRGASRNSASRSRSFGPRPDWR